MAWLRLADAALAPPAERSPAEANREDPLITFLPWVISFLLHAGLVLLAIFIVWTVQKKEEEDKIIIPIARLGVAPRAPLKMESLRSLSSTNTPSRMQRSLLQQGDTAPPSVLSAKITADELSLGEVETMQQSPFDSGIRAGAGLEAKFYGTGGNARRLIYLVDASGSLIDTLPYVINELKRSIGELSDRQSFTVIFFQGEDAIEVPPPGLKQATLENKQRVIRWIDGDSGNISPRGLSNPVKALRLALRYKPELLFILSDNITGQGRYEVDQQRLIADVERENKGGTKINTIQFLYRDPLEKYGLKPTLEVISERSGGIYKFLDDRELGIR